MTTANKATADFTNKAGKGTVKADQYLTGTGAVMDPLTKQAAPTIRTDTIAHAVADITALLAAAGVTA